MEMWKKNKIEKNKEKLGNTMKRKERKTGRHECQKLEMLLRLFRNTRGCKKK